MRKIEKTIIESLLNEGHNIVAIDCDPTAVNEVNNVFDVTGTSYAPITWADAIVVK